jgi:hypothetical protein
MKNIEKHIDEIVSKVLYKKKPFITNLMINIINNKLKVIFNKCGINPSIESLKSYLLTIENNSYC